MTTATGCHICHKHTHYMSAYGKLPKDSCKFYFITIKSDFDFPTKKTNNRDHESIPVCEFCAKKYSEGDTATIHAMKSVVNEAMLRVQHNLIRLKGPWDYFKFGVTAVKSTLVEMGKCIVKPMRRRNRDTFFSTFKKGKF